jgi:hypothetical protein
MEEQEVVIRCSCKGCMFPAVFKFVRTRDGIPRPFCRKHLEGAMGRGDAQTSYSKRGMKRY